MSKPRPLALVAEDTELGRWAIAHALKAHGYETRESDGWAESRDWLDRLEFDVAILSLSSERDDIGSIAEHMRNHHGRTGLILLSSLEDMGTLRSLCTPGSLVLCKPLEVDRVVLAAGSLSGRGRPVSAA